MDTQMDAIEAIVEDHIGPPYDTKENNKYIFVHLHRRADLYPSFLKALWNNGLQGIYFENGRMILEFKKP